MKKSMIFLSALVAVFVLSYIVFADNGSDVNDGQTNLGETNLSTADMKSRGYEIIDGDVYDLHGNLIIEMENGLTKEGLSLDPDFRVYYDDDSNTAISPASPAKGIVFNGTMHIPLNADDNQSVQAGSNFKGSLNAKKAYLTYNSGTTSGINFAVHSVTNNSVVGWVSNIQPDKTSTGISISSGVTYKAVVSAQGNAGSATMKIYTGL